MCFIPLLSFSFFNRLSFYPSFHFFCYLIICRDDRFSSEGLISADFDNLGIEVVIVLCIIEVQLLFGFLFLASISQRHYVLHSIYKRIIIFCIIKVQLSLGTCFDIYIYFSLLCASSDTDQ